MKTRLCALVLALLFMLSTAASAEIILLGDDQSEARFEIPIEILDQEWLLSQVDKAPNEFEELVVALYIMNDFQYGPAHDYGEIEDAELAIEGFCSWLDLMSFEYPYEDTTDGIKLMISDNIQIDIHCEGSRISRMDLIIKSIENGYGNDLTISVVK